MIDSNTRDLTQKPTGQILLHRKGTYIIKTNDIGGNESPLCCHVSKQIEGFVYSNTIAPTG